MNTVPNLLPTVPCLPYHPPLNNAPIPTEPPSAGLSCPIRLGPPGPGHVSLNQAWTTLSNWGPAGPDQVPGCGLGHSLCGSSGLMDCSIGLELEGEEKLSRQEAEGSGPIPILIPHPGQQ